MIIFQKNEIYISPFLKKKRKYILYIFMRSPPKTKQGQLFQEEYTKIFVINILPKMRVQDHNVLLNRFWL